MPNISVHLMIFPEFPASHIELVLESDSAFYSMNRWGADFSAWVRKNSNGESFDALKHTSKGWRVISQHAGNPLLEQQYHNIQSWIEETKKTSFAFDIQGDPQVMIEAWQSYQSQMKDKTSRLDENCAESMRRFLNQYAGCSIPKKGAISFPWDVFNAAKNQITLRNTMSLGSSHAHNMSCVENDSVTRYRLLKLSGFHGQLAKLVKYAETLDQKSMSEEADDIRVLIEGFQDQAKQFQKDGKYADFEKSCRDVISHYGRAQSGSSSVFSTAHQSMRMLKGVTAAVAKVKDNVLDITLSDTSDCLRCNSSARAEPPSDSPRSAG